MDPLALPFLALAMVLFYVAGRLHGRSRHKAFLARGFYYLAAQQYPTQSLDEPAVTARQIHRAFGSEVDHG